MIKERACVGCLLGTAVGDSLGLPYEGISPRRARRLFPDVGSHHLLFGKGMVSDDTEHACLVAQSLVRSRGEIKEFKTISWIERLGIAAARTMAGHEQPSSSPGYFVPGIVIRNLVFLFIILAHGFRRLAPPY